VSTETDHKEAVQRVIPLITQYIHDLADMLVGFVENGDHEGALTCLCMLDEAVSPAYGRNGKQSKLASAYVAALGGGLTGLLKLVASDMANHPAVDERRKQLRNELAAALDIPQEMIK
jgi:hypothetical protein